jgi:mono/diheme cytochrome c family protein
MKRQGTAAWLVSRFALPIIAITTAAPVQAADDALVEIGRRIYHQGILPDSQPLEATRPEGLMLEGRFAACVTCHRRSGMGSIEGLGKAAILVPPVAGPVLYAQALFANSFLDDAHHYIPNETWRRAMTRPAYDEETLTEALQSGRNSAGTPLEAPMPLYDLGPDAAAGLAAYLQSLGSAPDPGVAEDALHVATVVTPDVDPEDAEAVLGVLRVWARTAASAGKPWRLHEWRLTGPADSWAAQLDALYTEQNVFAMLSGLGRAQWTPVHAFCEANGVPCLLPSVDVVTAVDKGLYGVYYATGVTLEARILARYLESRTEDFSGRVVHVYADDAGRVAAEAFRADSRTGDIESVIFRYHVTAPQAAIREVGANDVLVLWLRRDEVAQLVAEAPEPLADSVYVSALLATPEDVDLPADWKRVSRFVTLFDDLGLQGEIARLRLERWLERNDLAGPANRRLQADAYAASYLFNAAIGAIRKQEIRRPAVPLTREHLLESLEDLVSKYSDGTPFVDTESHVAWYGRMSLGPGQRIAVRGGSIVGYESPESNRLRAVSEKIVP